MLLLDHSPHHSVGYVDQRYAVLIISFSGGRRTSLSRRRRLAQQAIDPGSGATPPARCYLAVCWLSCTRSLEVSAIHVHGQHRVSSRLVRRRVPAPPRFRRGSRRALLCQAPWWPSSVWWRCGKSTGRTLHVVFLGMSSSGHVVFRRQPPRNIAGPRDRPPWVPRSEDTS